MGTPLLDRINSRKETCPVCDDRADRCTKCGRGMPKPAWLERLTDQDRTGTIKVQR